MLHLLRMLSREFLGENRRNRDLVARYNPRRLMHAALHKLQTKDLLRACDVPVVETLAAYHFQHEIKQFVSHTARWDEFVIKPAQGTGGGGVVVVTERQDNAFLTLGGETLSARALENHLADILNGVYSLNRRYDDAFVERRLQAHPALARLSFQGLPDVRIIVFQGIPLMAMLRLATRHSKGRANLNNGGLGVGIDLVTGVTTGAISRRNWAAVHPDSQIPLSGIQVPEWERLVHIATQCADAIDSKYLGVDLVLDADTGPCVLELNDRPGLLIQLANRRGLRPLIEAVEQRSVANLSIAERVAFGRELYSAV